MRRGRPGQWVRSGEQKRVNSGERQGADRARQHVTHQGGPPRIPPGNLDSFVAQGQATDANGVSRRFIAAGEGHCFPQGTVDTFGTYVAPADFNETVNTLGQPLYAKQEPRKFDRGTDLHTQSNPLPMCHRPGVLVKLLMA
jgi:hypothetical protein